TPPCSSPPTVGCCSISGATSSEKQSQFSRSQHSPNRRTISMFSCDIPISISPVGPVMKNHALNTGAVRVKHSFLFPSGRAARQLGLFMPCDFPTPLPIHFWAIEHDGVLRLVDTGETATARNVPFARMEVTREQELPAAMAAAGLEVDDITEVVFTHAHGDH